MIEHNLIHFKHLHWLLLLLVLLTLLFVNNLTAVQCARKTSNVNEQFGCNYLVSRMSVCLANVHWNSTHTLSVERDGDGDKSLKWSDGKQMKKRLKVGVQLDIAQCFACNALGIRTAADETRGIVYCVTHIRHHTHTWTTTTDEKPLYQRQEEMTEFRYKSCSWKTKIPFHFSYCDDCLSLAMIRGHALTNLFELFFLSPSFDSTETVSIVCC